MGKLIGEYLSELKLVERNSTKIRAIREIRANPRFRQYPPQSQSHRRLNCIRRIPVCQSRFQE